jgi:hypothetical protein
MTHYIGLVIGDNIEGQLARYDENIEVERYRSPVKVRDWLKDELRTASIDPKDLHAIAKFLNEKYGDDLLYEQHHVHDGELMEWTTYNPDSKWDWWVIGGRWDFSIALLNGNITNAAAADEIDWPATFANFGGTPGVLVAEGVWRANQAYGWFGMSEPNENADGWDEWFVQFVSRLGNARVTAIDFHI